MIKKIGLAFLKLSILSVSLGLGAENVNQPIGVVQTFNVALSEATNAVNNAFSPLRYYEMLLITKENRGVRLGQTDATNEIKWVFVLGPGSLPLTRISDGKKSFPYYADFEITISSVATNQSEIKVVTTESWVRDKKEAGIHGAWAWHTKRVSPLIMEETNVLSRIERQLKLVERGDTNSLPIVPDGRTALQYRIQEMIDIDPKSRDAILRRLDTDNIKK